MEDESNEEVAFLDTQLKWSNGKISILVCRKSTHTTNTQTTALTTDQLASKVLFPLCLKMA